MADWADVDDHGIETPHASENVDVMNDPAYAPPQRRDTTLSKPGSEGGGAETCRICRSEGTLDEPLFYPCKCSGSIKFVHQECLMEWLSHSHKKHCELCKTPFRFTKLYDANMPTTLPWTVFLRRACVHLAVLFVQGCRALTVSVVWLVMLPWMIRWAWRWMFWFADAGWAREAFVRKQQPIFEQRDSTVSSSGVITPLALGLGDLFERAWTVSKALDTTRSTSPGPASLDDSSILSSFTYISQLTPNPNLNRVILDIFEGQLITCVVITGFILVFLIREWVVQQQPLVNLDNLNVIQREAERQQEREQDRLQRRIELLEQARQRLIALQNEDRPEHTNVGRLGQVSWENLEAKINEATDHLRKGGDSARESFLIPAIDVLGQVRAADENGESVSVLADKVYEKLASLSDAERQEWELVLLAEMRRGGMPATRSATRLATTSPGEQSDHAHLQLLESDDGDSLRRPPMPARDTYSRASQIQRTLEENDPALSTASDDPSSGFGTPGSTTVEPPTESGSINSVSLSDSSWQKVDHPNEQSQVDVAKRPSSTSLELDDIPITNAGPDAKINIKRSGKGKVKAVPGPKGPTNPDTDSVSKHGPSGRPIDELDEHNSMRAAEGGAVSTVLATPRAASTGDAAPETDQASVVSANPFHPEGPEPERRDGDVVRDRVSSVFHEEFGLDDGEQLSGSQTTGVDPNGMLTSSDGINPDSQSAQRQEPAPAPGTLQRISDWFWGDIQPQQAQPEPAPMPHEERLGDDDDDDAQEAPFVPVLNGQPILNGALPDEPQPENDPEVVAAAQQAGLDAEAIEEAEDLEGIFELIGFQGPLIGLFQTSCFCSVLVTGTIYACVGAPYLYGKLVLAIIAAPFTFLVKMPLQAASFIADVIIDITLMVVSWSAILGFRSLNVVQSTLGTWMPRWIGANFLAKPARYAVTSAFASAARLQQKFTLGENVHAISWHSPFLWLSVSAHASLKTLQDEVNAVLSYTGSVITSIVDTISSGSMALAWQRSLNVTSQLAKLPSMLPFLQKVLVDHLSQIADFSRGLSSGALTFTTSTISQDPSLVYWNSSDRGLAVLAGYLALAALAVVYVAVDRPITRSAAGQKTEKAIRDTLRQAGGVLKVILIISIEMLIFPFYCGLLLDLAFLPLFGSASVATRWAFATRAPSTFSFVHWFVGTCYMFHFALFVGMCRKVLRKGVLWFIRDPDDPTFHPVRDVLERNVTTQLRKIAFSALVYGALVILCLGGVIWSIGHIFEGIFPIHWISTEPVLEFPLDLLVYNFLTPLVIRFFRPSDAVHAMYAWWLRRCARVLRLSHFLFDDRREDEEGTQLRKTWASFLLMKTAQSVKKDTSVPNTNAASEVEFVPNGKYVLTPCNDQYRPPKPGEAFLHYSSADENGDGDSGEDVYIADKDGKRNEHFAKVYVPPQFRLRVTLFMVCLWMFSAFVGLCTTLVPLVFGRAFFAALMPHDVRVNDIYAYSFGAYVLGGALYAVVNGRSTARYLQAKAPKIDIVAWTGCVAGHALRAAKCVYVYGFLGLVLPVVFALLLQFYFILPLHTYLVWHITPFVAASTSNSTAVHAFANATSPFVQFPDGAGSVPTALNTEHTVHLLADSALGLLYVRIAIRGFVHNAPTSRSAEAFRLITANGYLNPNARLATRYVVLPALILAVVLILAPLGLARTLIAMLGVAEEQARIVVYRYSYPLAAGIVVMSLGGREVVKVMGRWRSRIRDEVYLVGERLHNFGERKPPVGSRSVIRKER